MSPHPTPTTGDETPRPLNENDLPSLGLPIAINADIAAEAAG